MNLFVILLIAAGVGLAVFWVGLYFYEYWKITRRR